MHVYDVEADTFHSYDCGEGRVPMFLAWDPVEPRLLAVEVKCIRGMQVRLADGTPPAPEIEHSRVP